MTIRYFTYWNFEVISNDAIYNFLSNNKTQQKKFQEHDYATVLLLVIVENGTIP